MRVSRTLRKEFQQFENNTLDQRNQLLVEPMTRNYHSGAPYLPGSTIKGALRTALVSCLAEGQEAFRLVPPRDGRNLEERALEFDFQQKLHEDPFRTIKVADAALAPDSTIVSHFENHHRNPEKAGSQKIKARYERLLSRADGAELPTFTVEIQVDEDRQHYGGRPLVGRAITLDDLREAANRFYAGRFKAEWDRFHAHGHMETAAALGRAFGANGVFHLPQAPNILLRVGRFSHFESLSVDHLREGHCPQARTPEGNRIKEGNTRNLCLLDSGERVPFGWLLLTPRPGDPAEQVRQPPMFQPETTTIPFHTVAAAPARSGSPWQRPPGALPQSTPGISPEQLARRQAMKIGEWLTTVKKVNVKTFQQWHLMKNPKADQLREEFHRWQRGQ
jgi:CRISPR-associated protein Csm5